MFGKCIKVENGISFQLVIVFDGNMSLEAAVQHLAKVNSTKQNTFLSLSLY